MRVDLIHCILIILFMSKVRKSGRQFVFKAIAIILPFVLIALLELMLRLTGYGDDYRIFVQDKINPAFIHLNPALSKKYFTYADNAPSFNLDPFKKIKNENTFRIFVLGESSALGYPYFHNGSFPRILKYRLQKVYPEMNFEVVNLSITAVNSYTVLDISKDLVKHEPDAIVIYAGHNEYYGALGVGSTQRMGGNPFLVNTLIFLKKIRTFQAVTHLYALVLRTLHPEIVDRRENLMKRMVSEQKVPYASDLYKAGIEQYHHNLEAVLKLFQQHEIPVFIGDLVNNEKDLKPFISALQSAKDTSRWYRMYQQALRFKDSDRPKALQFFARANQIDSTHALCHYYAGETAYAMGDYAVAKKNFFTSKELDLLRFRSPEEINEIIETLARQYDAYFVDIRKEFERNSPHGIVGEELITEHIHPNITGYFLMAESFCRSITSSGLIRLPAQEFNEQNFRCEYPFTRVDSLKGVYEIMMLREKWPFNEPIHDSVSSKGSYEAQLAGGLAIKQFKWDDAMNWLYEHYRKQDNKQGMLKIMEGFVLEYPYDPRYYEGAAFLSGALENIDKSLFYLTRAFQLKPSFATAERILLNYLKLDKPAEALPYIEYAMADNASPVNFVPLKEIVEEVNKLKESFRNDSLNVSIANSIGEKYMLIGNQSGAKKYFQKTLRIDKNNKTAIRFLSKITTN